MPSVTVFLENTDAIKRGAFKKKNQSVGGKGLSSPHRTVLSSFPGGREAKPACSSHAQQSTPAITI
jgi:hypothetical protein